MTLAASILSDATTVFTSTDDFAESVTYVPRSGSSRAIDAVVMREQIQIISEDGDTVAPVWQVHVANDATNGISSAELDMGGDSITLAPRDGKTAESRTITQLIFQDTGMLVLECR